MYSSMTECLCLFQACKGLGSERLLIEWSHLYAATHHKKAEKIAGSWTEDTFFNILSTLEQLGT